MLELVHLVSGVLKGFIFYFIKSVYLMFLYKREKLALDAFKLFFVFCFFLAK